MNCDYLLQNGTIIDGSGGKAYKEDVAISNGHIVQIGSSENINAKNIMDIKGYILAPGFIDIHRHGDLLPFLGDKGEAELLQGITSEINGNCGLSAVPMYGNFLNETKKYLEPITGSYCKEFATFKDYFGSIGKQPVNRAMLVGMGTLKACVMGFEDVAPTKEDYKKIHRLLERALSDGAIGVSIGLGYAPECFYSTKQLIEALQPLKNTDVPVSVHMRQEGDGVVEALKEMLFVAKALNISLETSHLKAIGKRNWNTAVPKMIELLNKARSEGVNVSCDVYPYTAGSTQLIHVIPPEFQKGGTEALTKALKSRQTQSEIIERIKNGRDFENIIDLVGFENVRAIQLKSKKYACYEGKSLEYIANNMQCDCFETLFDLLAEENCEAGMIDFISSQEDLEKILKLPFSIVISDATYPSMGMYHPRVYGAYTHLIEQFVVKNKVLTLEQAIHKITKLPATKFYLKNKGEIKIGADADLCVFKLDELQEYATWDNSKAPSKGMHMVFVNGNLSVVDSKIVDDKNGKMIKSCGNF